MPLLHPLFYLILVILMLGAIWEYNQQEGIRISPLYYIGGAVLVFTVGFRLNVGADYPAYQNIYGVLGIYYNFDDVWAKALFRESKLDIEWLYSLFNMSFFNLGLPFYLFTFFIAITSFLLKSQLFFRHSPYPTLSLLLLYMPFFLIAESGQMRQGVGSALAVFGFLFAIQRRLILFLFFIYLAVGVHKTNIVFLPAYWIIRIPMNSWRIGLAVLVSIVLSPFNLYEYIGGSFLANLAPQDIYAGYDGYINDEQLGVEMGFQKTDVLYLIVVLLMVIYDKVCTEAVPYYEYFRNLSVFGFCLFFLVKGNTIFAIRLPGIYIFFSMCMVLPCIAYGVKKQLNNNLVFALCLMYSVYITYSFTVNQGVRASFLKDTYNNFFLN